jgi:hypothetical protein
MIGKDGDEKKTDDPKGNKKTDDNTQREEAFVVPPSSSPMPFPRGTRSAPETRSIKSHSTSPPLGSGLSRRRWKR